MNKMKESIPYMANTYGNMVLKPLELGARAGTDSSSGLFKKAKEYSRVLTTAGYLGLSTLIAACGGNNGNLFSPSPIQPPNAAAKGSLVNKLGSVPCSGGHANFAGKTGDIGTDGSYEVSGISAQVPDGTIMDAVFNPNNCLPLTSKYHVKPGVNNFPAAGSVQNNVDGIPVDVETLRLYATVNASRGVELWDNLPRVEVYKDTFNDKAYYARALKGYIDNAVRKAFAELVTGSELPNYPIIEKSGNPPLWGENEIADVNELEDGLLIIQGPSGKIETGGRVQLKRNNYIIKAGRIFLSDQLSNTNTTEELGNAGGLSDILLPFPSIVNDDFNNRYRGEGSLSPHDRAYNKIRMALGAGAKVTEGKLDITYFGVIRPTTTESLPTSTEPVGTATVPIIPIPIEPVPGSTILDK